MPLFPLKAGVTLKETIACVDFIIMSHNPGYLKLVEDAKHNGVSEITMQEYSMMLESKTSHALIDVREDNEYAARHVKGACHLSKGVIEREIESKFQDKDTVMVLYCGAGFRSVLAAENISKMGYRKAVSLAGGWKALKESGIEVE